MKAAWLAVALVLVPATASAELTRAVDLKNPERPQPRAGEGAIVLRPHASSMAGDNRVLFYRWNPTTNTLLLDAQGKPQGVRVDFRVTMFGGKKGMRELRVAIVPAGDYVLAGRTFNANYTDVFCFGAPRFSVGAGEVIYTGDYEMFALAKMPDGERRNAMRYSFDLDAARASLRAEFPTLADRLALWQPVNGATFACQGDEFTAYAIPAQLAAATTPTK